MKCLLARVRHLLTRLRRSHAVDTDHRFIFKDDIGNVLGDHVDERNCVRFINDSNIHPRLRANQKFNKIINDIWKLAADWCALPPQRSHHLLVTALYAPSVDDVHRETNRVVTELAFYNIKPDRTDVCMPLHLHLQHAGPRSLAVCRPGPGLHPHRAGVLKCAFNQAF
eukprot:6173963-Pleurochrysis_carterae.AAC.1